MSSEKAVQAMVVPEKRTKEAKNDNPVIAGATAQVQSRYVIAQMRPRSAEQARVELLRECDSYAFADEAMYTLERGNKVITDLSIRFAEAATRAWQNMDTVVQMVSESEQARIIRVVVVDLETNNSWGGDICLERTVMRKKRPPHNPPPAMYNSYGQPLYEVPASEEEMTIKTNSAVSKTARNYILRHLPVWLLEECKTAIKATVKRGVESDKTANMRRLVEGFESLGIAPKQLEAYMGRPLGQVSVKEIESLRGLWVGIRDDLTTWAEALATRRGTTANLAESSGEPESVDQAVPAAGSNRTQELGAAMKKRKRSQT